MKINIRKIFLYLSFTCIFTYILGIVLSIVCGDMIYLLVAAPLSGILGSIFIILSKEEKYYFLPWLFLFFIFSTILLGMNS